MTSSWLPIADRIHNLPPYPFARLEELRASARSQGIDLIDLGMGNPDGSTPQPIIESAISALQDPKHHGYPPFEGTLEFRTAITQWYDRRYQVKLDPNCEALPLIGSKEGLNNLAMAYINPGDVVLVPTPAYPPHFRAPLIAGAELHELVLRPENNWLIDLDQIPLSVAQKAKIMYFNYPTNPTTATAPRAFFEQIVAFAHQHKILLVHDMAYAELAFDQYQPTSLLEIPGAIDIGVEFHTLSKTYNMAGWRVGFVVGNRHIIQGMRTIKTNIDYGIFSAIQVAAKTALELPDSHLETVRQRYQQRRDFLVEGLNQLGWQMKKPSATMYLWVPCPRGMASGEFALELLQKAQIIVTPGSAFGRGGEGYVRVSLIANCDYLGKALDQIQKAGIRYT